MTSNEYVPHDIVMENVFAWVLSITVSVIHAFTYEAPMIPCYIQGSVPEAKTIFNSA